MRLSFVLNPPNSINTYSFAMLRSSFVFICIFSLSARCPRLHSSSCKHPLYFWVISCIIDRVNTIPCVVAWLKAVIRRNDLRTGISHVFVFFRHCISWTGTSIGKYYLLVYRSEFVEMSKRLHAVWVLTYIYVVISVFWVSSVRTRHWIIILPHAKLMWCYLAPRWPKITLPFAVYAENSVYSLLFYFTIRWD